MLWNAAAAAFPIISGVRKKASIPAPSTIGSQDFERKAIPNIPEPTGRTSTHKAAKQEVVKLDILPDTSPDPQFNTLSFNQQSFSAASEINCCDAAIEICTGNSVIRMSNNIDPQLFGMVLSQLGGLK